jgi:hypothetical protein
MTSEVVDSSSMRALIRRWVKRCFKFTPVRKRAGSSLLSVGSTRFQDGEAAWMFLPPPRLIPEIDGHCSGGREKRQGCVKELRNRIKPKFSGGGTYRKCGDFSSQARSSFPPPKLLAVGDNGSRRSTHWKQRGTPVGRIPTTSQTPCLQAHPHQKAIAQAGR